MPTSQRKIESCRANAAKSTGPTTDSGKAASSLNAVTHGLSATTVVLATESQDQYQSELQDYLEYFQPRSKPELDLVRQLAAVHWRLGRYASVETGLLEQQMEEDAEWFSRRYKNLPAHHRLALSFERSSGSALSLLNRYEARIYREYRTIFRELQKLRSVRQQQDEKLQNEANPIIEHTPGQPVIPIPVE